MFFVNTYFVISLFNRLGVCMKNILVLFLALSSINTYASDEVFVANLKIYNFALLNARQGMVIQNGSLLYLEGYNFDEDKPYCEVQSHNVTSSEIYGQGRFWHKTMPLSKITKFELRFEHSQSRYFVLTCAVQGDKLTLAHLQKTLGSFAKLEFAKE